MFNNDKSGASQKLRFSIFSLLLGSPPPGTPWGFWEFTRDSRRNVRIFARINLVAAVTLLLSLVTYPDATLNAPLTVLFGFFALTTIINWAMIKSMRRSLRQFANHLINREYLVCFGCGYDLRNLSSNRCPECGHDYDQLGLRSLWNDWLKRSRAWGT